MIGHKDMETNTNIEMCNKGPGPLEIRVYTKYTRENSSASTWVRPLRCLLMFIPSLISMLHRASPHSVSRAAPCIEWTATVKFSSKCGCRSRRNGSKYSSPLGSLPLLKAGSNESRRPLFPPFSAARCSALHTLQSQADSLRAAWLSCSHCYQADTNQTHGGGFLQKNLS